jgi:Cu2+-exporting ATPase
MCCPGCQAVAKAIVDNGLDDFYRHRTAPAPQAKELVPEALRRLDLYDQPNIQRGFVDASNPDHKTASLILEGITCAACIWLNERHVRALPGVIEFQVNYSTHRARVSWDDSAIHLSDILKAIASIGYVAHPFDPGRQEAVQKKERAAALRRLAAAGIGAMQVMMLAVALYAGDYSGMEHDMWTFMRWVSLIITVPVVLYASSGFFVTAWRDLRRLQLSMEIPVSLAIGAAFSASLWHTVKGAGDIYFDSVCMFTFFLLASRFLEQGARHKAGQAAEALVKLLPAVATRIVDGKHEEVAVADLAPGDSIMVRPGDTVPADGEVLVGESSVDESLLTGESLPRAKAPGDLLTGGSVNVESPLVFRVDKVGEDTLVSGIVRLLDRAQGEKPRLAMLADRVAGWFVFALLVIAAGVAGWWYLVDPARVFTITLAVLVVTCPCALSLATPTALTAATGALTRLGLLTTRGHALETLAQATQVILDKTGTLTQGDLRLARVIPLGGVTVAWAKALAAGLELGSEHPVAEVLVDASDSPLAVDNLRARPGRGIAGEHEGVTYRIGSPAYAAALTGKPVPPSPVAPGTQVLLACAEGPVAWFILEDTPRQDAADAIAALKAQGLKVAILSGDAEAPVAEVAQRVGIEDWQSGLQPADKLDQVRDLQSAGEVVVMVGDGVNDAPVLAGAQVSVAMGSGAQLAHASADMVMLSEHLGALAQGVVMARRTRSIIRQNLAWAVLYNTIAVPLAAAGWVVPWMAALGMSASSLVVVFNALRLRQVG